MQYVFDTTEQTTASGNTAETRALLHLLSFDDDRGKIDAFAIDCFNDVTGMDNPSTVLFDVQSKATIRTSPRQIGEDLVTLYKNYISEFASFFKSYTLFFRGCFVDRIDRWFIDQFWLRRHQARVSKEG